MGPTPLAATAAAAGAKKRQPSRKGKKAWRKNIDISEIEESQADLLREEHTGGRLEHRPDEALFTIDKRGDEKVRERLRKVPVSKRDQILAGNVHTKPVPGRVNKATKSAKPASGKISKNAKAHKQPAAPGAQDSKKPLIWDGKEEKDDAIIDINGFTIVAKKPRVKAPVTLQEIPSVRPAVSAVDSGFSYNPGFESHRDLIKKAYEAENKRLIEMEELRKQQPIDTGGNSLGIEDMTIEPVDANDGHEAEAADNEESEEKAKKRKLVMKRKADRNREERRKIVEKAEKEAKERKKQVKELNKLKQLEKEVAEIEAKSQRTLEANKRKEEEKMSKPKRLSRHVFKPTSIPFQLPEEVSDSLRELKPEGNPFTDRFKSLQERNLIETRLPVSARRRYQLKEIEIHSYKRFK